MKLKNNFKVNFCIDFKKIGALTFSATISALLLSACVNNSDVGIQSNGQNNSANANKSEANDKPLNKVLANSIASVQLANPLSSPWQDAPLYLSFYELGLSEQDLSEQYIVLKRKGLSQAYQLIDRDGDGFKDGVFTLQSFKAAERVVLEVQLSEQKPKFNVTARTQAEVSIKEGGSWQAHSKKGGSYKEYLGGEFVNQQAVTTPDYYTDHSNWIRYEGPGIESDKIGYRIYLDERNGFDIFGKTQSQPVLQSVGQDGYDSYHHLQPWGMDILKVGASLGAGGFAYWDGQQLLGLKNVDERSVTITESGALYSSFVLDYKNWSDIPGQALDLKAQVSMHGASELFHNRIESSEIVSNLAAGFVLHPGVEIIKGELDITGDAYSYIASYGKQSLNDDKLGMVVFFRKNDLQEIVETSSSLAAVLKPKDQYLDYYFGAYWQGGKQTAAKNVEAFKSHIARQALMLTQSLRVNIQQKAVHKLASAEQALDWGRGLANSELERKAKQYFYGGWDAYRQRPPKFDYDIIGLLPLAYDELASVTNDKKYAQLKYQTTASFIDAQGNIARYKKDNFNIDNIMPGRALLRLYRESGGERYKIAAGQLRQQLREQPRTSNGAFWHKKKYPGQLWLDGVYMGMPFLLEYALIFEDGSELDHTVAEVVQEFKLTHEILRDAQTGLYYHAWDELRQQNWANPNTGLSPEFWSRGSGWLAMALADVISLLPERYESERKFLSAMAIELAQSIKTQRDPSGTWWQITNKPQAPGNYLESSASAMYTYFFAKLYNQGVFTAQTLGFDVKAFAESSYAGLVREFITTHPDGLVSLNSQCLVAGLGFGRDGSYEYYMSEPIVSDDPKGMGPFILASVEVSKLQERD